MQTSSDWRPADKAGNIFYNIRNFGGYSLSIVSEEILECDKLVLSTQQYCVPRNFVDSSSSSTPDRGPQFKALVSGNVETCAVWRSPGIWITSFNETTLFVSGDWRTVNSLHFLLPTKLLSCTRSSDRGHNEVSVVRLQSPGSLQTADYLDHGMGQLVKVSKRLEHWQIMYTVTLLPAWPRPL